MLMKILILIIFSVETNAFYEDSTHVIHLNSKNFENLVEKSVNIWMVEFYAPWCGYCERFASEYEKAANALSGVINIGAVNSDDNAGLIREHDISGYPTVKIYNSQKGTPETYEGERTASALVSFLLIAIHTKVNQRLDGNLDARMFKSKDIVELTELNFDSLVLEEKEAWLVVYYSSYCEHCKKLADIWNEVTAELKGFIKLGALDAISHFFKASDSKINGYPTITFFPTGKKNIASGLHYTGTRTTSQIVEWALKKLSASAPTPKITQIINMDSLEKACELKPLCLVSILPHILDCQSECRQEYLDILQKVSENYKKMFWGWVWSEAGTQPELEAALEIDGIGYPTMAAVNVKKMKYSVFVGSFSVEGINEFLRNLSYGYGDAKPLTLKEVPDIKTVVPWDGLDAVVDISDILDAVDNDNFEEMHSDIVDAIKDEL